MNKLFKNTLLCLLMNIHLDQQLLIIVHWLNSRFANAWLRLMFNDIRNLAAVKDHDCLSFVSLETLFVDICDFD